MTRSLYGRFDGTFGSSGTLNAPLATTHALVAPADETHVPDPEKLPVAFALEIDARVMEPDCSEQMLLNVAPLEPWPMSRLTELQATVLVGMQLTAMVPVAAVWPLIARTTTSDVVVVLGMFDAMFVLLLVASLYPAAQVVVNGVEARVADEIPPVALYEPPPPPV